MSGKDYCKEVYAWEDASWVAETCLLTWKGCRTITAGACAHYGLKPCKLQKIEGVKLSFYNTPTGTISLLKEHQNPYVVLHESAHHITHTLLDADVSIDHGKEWLGIYQWLLTEHGFIDKKLLRASMLAYGAPYCPLSPSKLGVKKKGE